MTDKASFEILCATMNQSDFSLIQKMNVRSSVVFANQCQETRFDKISFGDGRCAKMISTETRGVGINRNLALMYSSADICLFSDDDVVYRDNLESLVLEEFEKYKKADIIIFHFQSDSEDRPIKQYSKTHRIGMLSKKPWATFQIAFRRSSYLKNSLFFTTLFGGGCLFPCGEDTQWIRTSLKKGLKLYVSNKTIGNVSFQKSSWFKGYVESYYYGQGAAYQSSHKRTKLFWFLYTFFRTRKMTKLTFSECYRLMSLGAAGFDNLVCYDEYYKNHREK